MPSLKSILKPIQTIILLFEEEEVKVSYRPQYLTPEFEEKLKALNEEDQSTDAFLELFCSVVVEWDLTEGDEPDSPVIPITKEALRKLPYDVLGEVLEKVQKASVPNPPTEPNSGDTSLQAAGSAPSQTGMD